MEQKNPGKIRGLRKQIVFISLCAVVVSVVLCVAFPSISRSIYIHPFLHKLIGSTWGHISNVQNDDFCDYHFVDQTSVICTDRFGDKHLGEWNVTGIGKVSTDIYGGIRPTEGKSISVVVIYKSTSQSGREKVYTSDLVMVHDSGTGSFKLYEQPGDSYSDILYEFGEPR